MSQENNENKENNNQGVDTDEDTMKVVEPIGSEEHSNKATANSNDGDPDDLDIEEAEELEVEEFEEPEPYIAPSEDEWNGYVEEYERVKAELESMTTRLKSVSLAYTKKQDEVEVIRKRLQRDAKLDEVKRRGEVVKILFEPLDNLTRSIETQKKAGIDEAQIQGLEFVYKAFMKGFHSMGLEEIPGIGSKFDPNLHEALLQMPVQDPLLGDTVMQVHSTGYRIEGIILRPSQVIVGNYTPPPKEESEEEVKNNDDESPQEVKQEAQTSDPE